MRRWCSHAETGAGVDGFLIKPISYSPLLDTLVSLFPPADGEAREQYRARHEEAQTRLVGRCGCWSRITR